MAVKFENLTILFTDIVGYTDMTSQSTRDESATMLRDYNRLMLPVISAFGGRRVKSIGDAFLVTFRSPTDGVRCAMALQDTAFEYNRGRTEGTALHIRASLSLGEVRHDSGDVFGEPVNIAARIEGVTPPDEIYFSGSVYLAMNKAEVPSEAVGKQTFKGIPEPVFIYRVPRFKLSRLVATTEPGGEPEVGFPFGGLHRQIDAPRSTNPVRQVANVVRKFLKDKNPRTLWMALAGVALVAIVIAGAVFLRPFSTGTAPDAEAAKPAITWPLLKQAEGDVTAGRWKAVVQIAENALKSDPKNAEALLLKGYVAYGRDRKPGVAIQLYGEALQANPNLKTEDRMLTHLVAALHTVGQPAADVLARYPSPTATKHLAERTGKPGFVGRNRAVELLTRWGDQKKINDNKRALLDLEEAPECAQRLQAVLKIRERKLAQALPTLKKMTDVGFFDRVFANHPNACLFDDAKKAIEALESKAK